MPEYRNSSPYRRVWPHLTVDGRTVELEPDATVELGDVIDDPWLTAVDTPAAAAKTAADSDRAVPSAAAGSATSPAASSVPALPAESKE